MKLWVILGVGAFALLGFTLLFIKYKMSYRPIDRVFIMQSAGGDDCARVRLRAPGGVKEYLWPDYFAVEVMEEHDSRVQVDFIPLNDEYKDWYAQGVAGMGTGWTSNVYITKLFNQRVRFKLRKARIRDGPELSFIFTDTGAMWYDSSYGGGEVYGQLIEVPQNSVP